MITFLDKLSINVIIAHSNFEVSYLMTLCSKEKWETRLRAFPQTNQEHSWDPLAGLAARTIQKV